MAIEKTIRHIQKVICDKCGYTTTLNLSNENEDRTKELPTYGWKITDNEIKCNTCVKEEERIEKEKLHFIKTIYEHTDYFGDNYDAYITAFYAECYCGEEDVRLSFEAPETLYGERYIELRIDSKEDMAKIIEKLKEVYDKM